MTTIFHNSFFSLTMRQHFNRKVARVADNENEAPLHKLLRMAGQL